MMAIARKPSRNRAPQMLSEENLRFGQLVQDRATNRMGTYKGVRVVRNRNGSAVVYLKVRWLSSQEQYSYVKPHDITVIDTPVKRRRARGGAGGSK